MKGFVKIKAQAMQFALLVSVVVAVLLSTFLVLTHVQSFFRIKSQELVEASSLTHLQIFDFLDTKDRIKNKDTAEIVEGSRIHKLASGYYGAYLKVFSEVAVHGRKIAKTALAGTGIEDRTPNIYLANTNSPLVVVGDTRIEGNNYLPKQGVKAGTISGNYYQGSRLYYGRVFESKEKIPELNKEWRSYLETVLDGGLISEEQLLPLSEEITQSFLKPTKIIYQNEPIILGDNRIAGNVILQSGTKIVVTPAARLTDVLLVAPVIEVGNRVDGTFQLIATKKVEVGKQCHLRYPSAIVLYDRDRSSSQKLGNETQKRTLDFRIGTNTSIEGAVVYLKQEKQKGDRIKTHLKVENGVEIIGEVYCDGNADFQGTVRGSLYAQQLIANQSGSIYLNHLYNGKVVKNPIDGYAGLPFDTSTNTIAKWMY